MKNGRKHEMNKFIKSVLKEMRKHIHVHTTNNYRKMHGLPMRRKDVGSVDYDKL